MAQVTVKKGLLIYVSFAQGATSDDVARAAKTLLSLPLCTLTGQWGDGRYLSPPSPPSVCVSAFLCLSVCLSVCLSHPVVGRRQRRGVVPAGLPAAGAGECAAA